MPYDEEASHSSDERTHHEATLDVLYGIRFNDLNERFYRRMDGLFSIINIAGGSAIFIAFLGGEPAISGIVGLIIAMVAYIDREIRPAQKAVMCGLQRTKFGSLASRAAEMSLVDIDRELRILQAEAPPTIEALSEPAHRSNLRSNGYTPDTTPLPLLSRLACLLA